MSNSSEDDRCSEGSPVAELAGNATSTRRRRHGSNITSWIVNRECGLGAAEPAYFRVPHRLCTSIESLVDADGLLLRATVLGYTRDGEHLLGYAHDGGKYTLHVWRLRPSKPACLLCSTTLFATRTSSVAEFLTPDDERALPLLVTMCELAEGDTLVIHGAEHEAREPVSPGGENASSMFNAPVDTALQEQTQRSAFVTVLPAPWTVPMDDRGHAVARHFAYSTVAPHPELDARLCIQGRLLLLPTGDGVVAYQLHAPARLVDDAIREQQQRDGTDGSRSNESKLKFPAGTCTVEPSPTGTVFKAGVTMRCHLEAEKYIARMLAQPLRSGYRLVDYTVLLVDSRPVGLDAPHDGELAALVLIMAALRKYDALDTQPVRPVALMVALNARTTMEPSQEQGAGLLPVAHFTVKFVHNAELCAVDAALMQRLAESRAAALRRHCCVPLRSPHALPHVVDNRSVLQRWVSVPVLRHPALPIAILGFGVTLGNV